MDAQPTGEQVHLFTVLSWAGLATISVIAVAWLTGLWRSARRPYVPPQRWRIPITPPPAR